MGGVASRVEGAAEYLLELFVEAANAEGLEIVLDYLLEFNAVAKDVNSLCGSLGLFANDGKILNILNDSVCLECKLRIKTNNAINLDADNEGAIGENQGQDFSLVDIHTSLENLDEGILHIFFFEKRRSLLVHWVFIVFIYYIYRELYLTQRVLYYLWYLDLKFIIFSDHHSVPLELAESNLALLDLLGLAYFDNKLIEFNEDRTVILVDHLIVGRVHIYHIGISMFIGRHRARRENAFN